jgi:glycosyltransferase involved in cell wall biosynthesis
VADVPENVEFLQSTISFSGLRDLYAAADLVVVPLFEGPNQAGVTTILEAMSMGLPVIASATEGQREVLAGPLIRPDGSSDAAATLDRGPQVFGSGAPSDQTGVYVAPGDHAGLRAAIQQSLEDRTGASAMGATARVEACRVFQVEQFAERFATLLLPTGLGGQPRPEGAPT